MERDVRDAMELPEPELTNKRAKREWLWLCQKVGEKRTREAIARIPGKRCAYPLNIACVLGLELPPSEELPRLPEEIAASCEKGFTATQAAVSAPEQQDVLIFKTGRTSRTITTFCCEKGHNAYFDQ